MTKLLSSMFLLGALSAACQSLPENQTHPTIQIHAHRGGRAAEPENTIPAFEYAIHHGVDVLELDLAVTKDNVLVVSHSPYITQPASEDPRIAAVLRNERQCDGPALAPGTAIHSLTLAQVKQYDCGNTVPGFPHQVAVPHTPIPTFEEVLNLAPQGNFGFNVETKIFINHPEMTPSPEAFVALIDEAVKRHHLQSRVILQSFDFRTLRAMKTLDPSIRRSALFGQARYDVMMGITDSDKTFTHVAQVSGATILSPDESLVTPDAVRSAHQAGLQVIPYTVNTPEGWKKMADAHVDAIITDDPAGLADWFHSRT
ncbi:glycerophosphodiester phosphodiesterase family protein [Granulicella sp. dw_53]|uniref:glycerophosphodiester phosphodiesterase family protein n=1 Tax=Granulicella sp. dw_53 TaxID=2719792 RepID=UPI001BD61226|nr:glycerophosphodiester phosphodiesterase family protein [Granulicella sp. dw_53]